VYIGVPPAGVTVAVPLLPPLQLAGEVDTLADSAIAGCVIVTVLDAVQLFASETVTVYVPAASPVAVAAAPPEGVQLYV
jgi:hypothetical protein